MKKKVSIIVSLVLAMIMSLSVTLADYDYTEVTEYNVGGRDFIIRNGISDNRKNAYAKTTGGTNTYNTVVADFYYMNYTTHQSGSYLDYTLSSSIEAKVNAPELSYAENKKYYEVNSDHGGSYNGSSFTRSGIQTLID